MNHCCLHVDLTLAVPVKDWLDRCESAVPAMRAVTGLVWKLWLLDEPQRRAGGLYLFESEARARAYADGPLIGSLRTSGLVHDLTLRVLPVLDALSRQTNGLQDAPREVLRAFAG